MPLRGQLGVRLLAVGECVAELVHDERDRGQEQKAAPGEGVSESTSHAFDRTGARVRLLRRSMGAWLDPSELRIGLGCMRLSTDEDATRSSPSRRSPPRPTRASPSSTRARATSRTTSRCSPARCARCGAAARARIVTKGGMRAPAAAGSPTAARRRSAPTARRASPRSTGSPIDLYLMHAPDPRTPWRTSRARARAARRRGARAARRASRTSTGRQLDEALELAPIAAVQVALSPFDDRALRGGVVERCAERGIARDRALAARRPAPRRARSPARAGSPRSRRRTARPRPRSRSRGCSSSPRPWSRSPARGARRRRARPRARRRSARRDERDAVAARSARRVPRRAPATARADAEVVLVMGIPGAGKSRVAEDYVARGYLRLNRDERGGSLRALADALDEALAAGARRVVLDNTYLTRAARSYVVEAAAGTASRCAASGSTRRSPQAQVNLVERLLDRFGVAADARGAARARARSRACSRRRRRCARSASSSRRRPTRASPTSSACRSCARRRRARRGRRLRRGRRAGEPGWERARAATRRAAPRLRLAAGRGGGRARRAAARLARRSPARSRAPLCPHPRRPAELLVPAAAARACRSPSRAHRRRPRRARPSSAPRPRTGRSRRARRALRRGLSVGAADPGLRGLELVRLDDADSPGLTQPNAAIAWRIQSLSLTPRSTPARRSRSRATTSAGWSRGIPP